MRGKKRTKEEIEKSAKAKYKKVIHVESGIVYQSRKDAVKAFGKNIDFGLKKGHFRYI